MFGIRTMKKELRELREVVFRLKRSIKQPEPKYKKGDEIQTKTWLSRLGTITRNYEVLALYFDINKFEWCYVCIRHNDVEEIYESQITGQPLTQTFSNVPVDCTKKHEEES